MFNKAIAGFITNGVILGGAVGLPVIDLSPEMVAAIATIANGVIVWAVPNKT